MATPFQQHVDKWKDCERCPLCTRRHLIVLSRGRVPCDVLFVGEAPGTSEDVLGRPFVGEAGHLLDDIVSQALGGPASAWHGIETAFTNLVACIPLREDGSGKLREPPEESLDACEPRLKEFIALCRPKLVVAVGSLARDRLDPKRWGGLGLTVPQVHILHPAYILSKLKEPRKGWAIRDSIAVLANAVREVLG